MNPIIIAIIFSIVVIVAIYIVTARSSKSTVKNMNLRIKELAERLGLQVPKTATSSISSFFTVGLSGLIKDRNFHFTNYIRSEKTSNKHSTEFSWECQRRETPCIIISREGLVTSFRKQFGLQDIEIGDKNFDGKFLVKCDDTDYAKRILTAALCNEILKKERVMYGSITIQNQEVHYIEPGLLVNEQDVDRLVRLIDLCKIIAIETEK